MKRLCLMLVLFCGCFAQPPRIPNNRYEAPNPCPSGYCGNPLDDPSPDPTLSDGKTQIVTNDYRKNLEDSANWPSLPWT